MRNSEKVKCLSIALVVFATIYALVLIFYFIPYLEAAYESAEYVIEHEILNYFLQFGPLPDYNLTLLFLISPIIFSYLIGAWMYRIGDNMDEKSK